MLDMMMQNTKVTIELSINPDPNLPPVVMNNWTESTSAIALKTAHNSVTSPW